MIRTALKFGAFVAVCLFFTGYLAFTIGNLDVRDPLGRQTYSVSATFDDVTGLLVDDNVKVAGVVVGKVTSVHTEAGKAVVSFDIDNDHADIPKDSSAAIRWRNLIGQRYVYLYPGDSAEALEDGDVIAKTASVVDLGELFNRLGPIVGAIDPAQVNEFLDTITAALDGREDEVGKALDDLAVLTHGLASRDDSIHRLIGNLDTVAQTVNQRDAQIETMLQNLITLSDTFGDNTATLDAALVELGSFGSELDDLLAEQQHGDRPPPRQPGAGHRHGPRPAAAARRGIGRPGRGQRRHLPGGQPRRVPEREDHLRVRRRRRRPARPGAPPATPSARACSGSPPRRSRTRRRRRTGAAAVTSLLTKALAG